MEKFIDLEKTGKLYYDKIIFETYYPILFTCTNEEKKLFLCVCCQSNTDGIKWLITETCPEVIIEILKNEITLRSAFLKNAKSQISIFEKDGDFIVEENDPVDWNPQTSRCLPDEGEYMEAENGEFDAEIEYYSHKINDNICQHIIDHIKVDYYVTSMDLLIENIVCRTTEEQADIIFSEMNEINMEKKQTIKMTEMMGEYIDLKYSSESTYINFCSLPMAS